MRLKKFLRKFATVVAHILIAIINYQPKDAFLEKQIFYSWQSDLPNNSNRGFIQRCIEKAIANIASIGSFLIEFNLERDTKNSPGTPDIINTIFSKIDKSEIFIADVSIVSAKTAKRKTPNPNVLVELGYAAKTIGWENIICVYNLARGKIEDLPFDLRFRRPLLYAKTEAPDITSKNNLIKQLETAIIGIAAKASIQNEVFEYIKVKIDGEVMSLLKILFKIIYSYDDDDKALSAYPMLLSITDEDIRIQLQSNTYLGFQLFKNLDSLQRSFETLLENPLTISSLSVEQLAILPKFLKNILKYQYINNWRYATDLYIDCKTESADFIIQNGKEINESNPADSFLLLRKLDNGTFTVQDFGNFIEKDKIETLLNAFSINPSHLDSYSSMIREFLHTSNQWISKTGNQLVIDNKRFTMKAKTNN
jgi:hypothetical protein